MAPFPRRSGVFRIAGLMDMACVPDPVGWRLRLDNPAPIPRGGRPIISLLLERTTSTNRGMMI